MKVRYEILCVRGGRWRKALLALTARRFALVTVLEDLKLDRHSEIPFWHISPEMR